jgi:integrative and conjugative element protein (TIGR02256 family)
MLEAIKSCLVEYDGELIQVTRGRTRVAPDHPIAKARPDAFRPAIASRSNDPGRERVYASGLGEEFAAVPSELQPQPDAVTSERIKALWAKRGGPRPKSPRWELPVNTKTTLSDNSSRFSVSLAAMARKDLIGDIEATSARDQLEFGAAVFGLRVKSWDTHIRISQIGEAGPNGCRTATSFGRDHVFDAVQNRRVREQSGGIVTEIGMWHSHLIDDPTPSGTDLAHLSGSLGIDVVRFRLLAMGPGDFGGTADAHDA